MVAGVKGNGLRKSSHSSLVVPGLEARVAFCLLSQSSNADRSASNRFFTCDTITVDLCLTTMQGTGGCVELTLSSSAIGMFRNTEKYFLALVGLAATRFSPEDD